MSDLPEWMAGLDYKDWLFDGHRCTAEMWSSLDWSGAWMDMGPSVAGNLGPYWHVRRPEDETVHRLYPRLLQTKWLLVVRQAIEEGIRREDLRPMNEF